MSPLYSTSSMVSGASGSDSRVVVVGASVVAGIVDCGDVVSAAAVDDDPVPLHDAARMQTISHRIRLAGSAALDRGRTQVQWQRRLLGPCGDYGKTVSELSARPNRRL